MCEACAACCTLQGKWGEDLYSPVPRPMFLVRLVIVAGQLMYDPPLDTIEQAVLEAFDAIVLRSANIDEITTKVSLGVCMSSKADALAHTPCPHMYPLALAAYACMSVASVVRMSLPVCILKVSQQCFSHSPSC